MNRKYKKSADDLLRKALRDKNKYTPLTAYEWRSLAILCNRAIYDTPYQVGGFLRVDIPLWQAVQYLALENYVLQYRNERRK